VLDDDTRGGDGHGVDVASAAAHDGVDQPRHHALRLAEEELLPLRHAEPQEVLRTRCQD